VAAGVDGPHREAVKRGRLERPLGYQWQLAHGVCVRWNRCREGG
jgi:hypothetical protein